MNRSLTQNVSDLDFDLARPESSILRCSWISHYFLLPGRLVCNSNIWPKSKPLQDTSLQTLNDLDFDLPWPVKVKSNGSKLDYPYTISY